MFAKPYKLKSTNTLKNSEKKHLGQRIKDEFPAATDERVKELVPVKSNTSCLKLVLHSGETVTVYSVESVPIMIERESGLVPTVCALWQVPELVPTIVVQPHVLTKIAGGAPLYVPGVVRRADGGPRFGAGAVIAAATTDNMAVGAVGRAAMSSGDLILRATGVLMEALHVCGDHLCRDIKFHKVERPQMSATEPRVRDTDQLAGQVGQLHIQPPPPKEEWPALGRAAPPPVAPVPEPPAPVAPVAPAPNEPRVITEETAPADGNDVLNDSMNSDTLEEEELGIPADMDGLLRWCLLAFLKMQGKHLELPLKTNLLYKNHLFPLCPADRTLDVKKSSYKKLSKFLEAMEREGLLQVKEIDKGVSAITSVNAAHPLVRGVRVPAVVKETIPVTAPAGPEDEYVPPVVREMLCVTAAVSELFHMVRKGTALPPGEVRTVLTEYVKTHQLKSSELKGGVTLDAMLAKICNRQEQEVIKWDALMSGVVSRMTIATEMTHHGGAVTLSRSRLEPVSMQVVTRSGNKKVTLVSNLEAYGFTLPRLSVACQRAVGASCGVTRSPGAKADQLMLQGDQTHFVAKLLIEKYGLPKKYVDGADKALNKKK